MLIGLGIALLSILTVTAAAENLGETAWCLPALMLILFGRTCVLNPTSLFQKCSFSPVIVVNHLPRGYYTPKIEGHA